MEQEVKSTKEFHYDKSKIHKLKEEECQKQLNEMKKKLDEYNSTQEEIKKTIEKREE